MRVAENDDVLDAQGADPEFQRRRDAVRLAVRRIRRDDIRDVADDEQFAGAGIENDLRRDAGIAAADDHDLRRLPGPRQFVIAVLLPLQPTGGEGAVALDQTLGKVLVLKSDQPVQFHAKAIKQASCPGRKSPVMATRQKKTPIHYLFTLNRSEQLTHAVTKQAVTSNPTLPRFVRPEFRRADRHSVCRWLLISIPIWTIRCRRPTTSTTGAHARDRSCRTTSTASFYEITRGLIPNLTMDLIVPRRAS